MRVGGDREGGRGTEEEERRRGVLARAILLAPGAYAPPRLWQTASPPTLPQQLFVLEYLARLNTRIQTQRVFMVNNRQVHLFDQLVQNAALQRLT